MDFTVALSTASATIDLVKSLKELDHALDKSELKVKMAELYGNLADVKMALVDAETTAVQQEAKISDLTELLARKAELLELDGFSYAVKDGKANGLPFCPTCLHDGQGLYQIVATKLSLHSPRLCPKCKFDYGRSAIEYRDGSPGY